MLYRVGVGDTAKFGFDLIPSNTGPELPILIPILFSGFCTCRGEQCVMIYEVNASSIG